MTEYENYCRECYQQWVLQKPEAEHIQLGTDQAGSSSDGRESGLLHNGDQVMAPQSCTTPLVAAVGSLSLDKGGKEPLQESSSVNPRCSLDTAVTGHCSQALPNSGVLKKHPTEGAENEGAFQECGGTAEFLIVQYLANSS